LSERVRRSQKCRQFGGIPGRHGGMSLAGSRSSRFEDGRSGAKRLLAKPICLEVCSGEGGSTRGLMNAGWDVIAVDNSRARLKRNPARWRVLGDAFDAIAAVGADVDLIWAGWPCQDYSAGTRAARAHGIDTGHKRLIAAGREAMAATGTPWQPSGWLSGGRGGRWPWMAFQTASATRGSIASKGPPVDSLKKQNPKYYYFEHGYFKPGGVG
jgi:hypothetical protein